MTSPYLASISKYERFALTLLVTVVFGGAASLAYAEISGAVVAQGTVVVEKNSRKIQHLDGGIVSELRVKNGDTVAAGNVLLKLDSTEAAAMFDIAEAQLDEINVHRDRLICESVGCAQLQQRAAVTITTSATHRNDALWLGQSKLLDARRDLRVNKKNQINTRMQQLDRGQAAIHAQIQSLKRQLDLSEQELRAIAPLEKSGLVSLTRTLTAEREHERLSGEIVRLEAELERLAAQMSETRLQLSEVDQSNLGEILSELRDVDSKRSELIEKVTALRARRDRATVIAPSSGIVHNLTATTITGVIKPGETVAEIVPQNEDLILEARVETAMVDRLSMNQLATVHFSGFDQRTTPTLMATVSMVAPDANQDTRSGQAYYIVQARLSPGEVARLGGQAMRPGMPCELHFSTGERSVLSYLTKPFTDQMYRAMRER